MGVCGTGKSSLAARLAAASGGRMVEADDHHSPANLALMASGRPLGDADRWPWLDAIAAAAGADEAGLVAIACSALKRRYRDRLRERLGALALIHLTGDPVLIRARLEARPGHFMPPSLLDSQLAELEPPAPDECCLTVDAALTAAAQDAAVAAFLARLKIEARP
jgi:carbohydrate kinase (thermoresistant glucokinase family)